MGDLLSAALIVLGVELVYAFGLWGGSIFGRMYESNYRRKELARLQVENKELLDTMERHQQQLAAINQAFEDLGQMVAVVGQGFMGVCAALQKMEEELTELKLKGEDAGEDG